MRRIFLILILILALAPAPVSAEGVTVLVGAQTVSFGGDVGTYYDIPPGPGITLFVGFDMAVAIDLRIGRRKAVDGDSNGDVIYQWIEVGPRFVIGNDKSTIRPDWFVGIGSYDLEIGSQEYDTAIGGYIGVGIEEGLSEKFIGRVEVKGVSWQSETIKTDGATLNISLLFGVKF